MKRINEYKKLFGVENQVELKTLKKSYRDLVKAWHPDKFQNGDALQEEAEIQSRKIIDGYHFLVSIAPETIEANLPNYTETITNSGIADYVHKGLLLEITFLDGSTYEYFGVTKPVYIKMINSDKLNRFAKRNIYPNYIYRKSKRVLEEV
ncbi:KTSC domain-containing protein [Subsaximicrobium wynnwilliamsii]|uniref:KTSC domain-containing protein n=1 Tax=Subsaximicrobium wynnwilliamsii TaxID=291179 RepID=A0A5C6ZKJ6_9FLAO|nr:KTSC domain-containing protein [Subsaximicrobium wynnwilliamsii]TXD84434.1 KTSC domain-containing protein [Subsaximicrobium wynnwilliamsii]TXD90115.1 KTSC domain-containing protein [Subsaximicrobium wynnwilliamsii]TXE04167.1 KTSC domain-containing protein [Subsaximicrobium wynnwilliamsii]